MNSFAIDFLQYESQNRDNVFFSSASISTAFAMLASGAKSRTQHGLHQALHLQYLPDLDDKFDNVLISLQSDPNNTESFDLIMANKVYTQNGSTVLEQFKNTLKSKYHADIEVVDFVTNQGRETADKINSWVSDKTKGLIKELVEPPMDPRTKLVLVNAIYFEGAWQRPFEKEMNQNGTFHGIDETQVEFMNEELYVRVLEPENMTFVLLELTYKGNASMIILLPNQDANLDDIVSVTASEDYESLIGSLMSQRLKKAIVFLPKFKLESLFDLKPVIGINGQPDLYLSKAIHKAVVDVDETGTKAAAVTALFPTALSRPLAPTPVYKVDRPFLFFIRDHGTGINLFTGLVGQL
ncbi:Serpin B9 [Halotydeus destructor]|nr:Serpin B9 [Halotydeus destructor]